MDGLLTSSEVNLEEEITNILKIKGFNILNLIKLNNENTEIIAEDNRLITKGKYLFHINTTGEEVQVSELRELLGELFSERINKGIIVLKSYLSNEAVEFASKNNIEIINYENINSLINECKEIVDKEQDNEEENIVLEEVIKEIEEPIYFIDMEEFDKESYIKVQKEVEKFGLYSQQKKLKELFQYYINNNKYEINKNGLIDEYIQFNNKVIKMYDEDRSLVVNREDNKLFNRYLYLLKGDIVESLDVLSDFGFKGSILDIGIFTDWSKYLTRNSRNETFFCPNVSMLLKNYLIIFNYVDFKEGKEAIIELFEEYIQKVKKGRGKFSSKLGRKSYDEYFEEDERKYRSLIIDIENNVENIIHCPIGIRVNKRDDSYEMEFSKESVLTVSDLFLQYDLNKDNIKEMLSKDKDRIIKLIKSI